MSRRPTEGLLPSRRPHVLRHAYAENSPRYTPRRPERTDLYKLVIGHLEEFLRAARDEHERGLPRYVEQELRAYLNCGIVARGFVHARCTACGRDLVVAFSCKRRGVCPSCNARRMWNTGFVVADRLLPDAPVRQWVLSTPFEIRLLLAANAGAFGALTRIFAEEVLALQRRRGRDSGLTRVEGGLLVFQHRFGGSLNLNTHLHAVVVDGVFERGPRRPRAATGLAASESRATFHELPAPRSVELQDVAFRVYARFVRWLRRRGLLRPRVDEDSGESGRAGSAFEACLRGSLGTGTLHRLPDAEQEDPAPSVDDDARRFALERSPHAADFGGFGIHAGVTVPAGDPAARARLVRYCARAPLSLERLSVTPEGMVVYRIRKPWRKEQICRVMTPLDFLGRLCALIPAPRHPLLRFYGVFAPASSWRALCVPLTAAAGAAVDPAQPPATCGTARVTTPETSAAVEVGGARSQAGAGGKPAPPTVASETLVNDEPPACRIPWRIDWATLLKKTYDLDVLACPCGGRMKVTALVTDPEQAREILERLGLPSVPPPLPRARSPDAA